MFNGQLSAWTDAWCLVQNHLFAFLDISCCDFGRVLFDTMDARYLVAYYDTLLCTFCNGCGADANGAIWAVVHNGEKRHGASHRTALLGDAVGTL